MTAKRKQSRKASSVGGRKPAPRAELVEQEPTAQPVQDIHGRAMLVSVRISMWAARKFDRKVTEEVNAARGADKDAGRYNKHLFAGKADSHASVVGAASSARLVHYTQTLPWLDEGWRLLPSSNFSEYTDALRESREKFERAVDAFVSDYPMLQDHARVALNGLYRSEDYPDVSELRHRFRFGVEYAPLPARGDFRLDLPAEQIRQIEGTVEERVKRATELAMRDAWNRLYEIVAKIHERMADPDNTPKKSLFEGGQSIVQVLARLNVTGDVALEAMRQRIESELLSVDAKTLRENATEKEVTAKRAAEIMAKMQDVYGGGLGGEA